MASPLGYFTDKEARYRIVYGAVRSLIGLLLTWMVIGASFQVDFIRSRYEGMTSFTPLGGIITALLSPLWLALHFLILIRYTWFYRSIASIVIPVLVVSSLALSVIYLWNDVWMAEPGH